MGLIRKTISASTLGTVDFRSDKERIARSTRKNGVEQRLTNRLLAEQNRLLGQEPGGASDDLRPVSATQVMAGDPTYAVPATDLWAVVKKTLEGARIRKIDHRAMSLEANLGMKATTGTCIATVAVRSHPSGSVLQLRVRMGIFSEGQFGADKRVHQEWARLMESIEAALPVDGPLSVDTCPETISPISAPVSADSSASLVDQLTQLSQLHEAGALTAEEYQGAKARIIGA